MILPALLLTGLLVMPDGTVYDREGQRQGYVKEPRPGHFDLYDRHSRRLGYGRATPDGRIEFFDTNSRRILTIQPGGLAPRTGGRR
jgi:hypothetical protein